MCTQAGPSRDRDRPRLERLCRYIARPPLAQDRLEEHGDGRLRYRLKAPSKDGTHPVLLHPLDVIACLCALIPAASSPRTQKCAARSSRAARRRRRWRSSPTPEIVEAPLGPPPPSRHSWSSLLKRVFAVDIFTCPRCEGEMRVVEIATDHADIARVRGALGLGPQPQPPPRPSPPAQLTLRFE